MYKLKDYLYSINVSKKDLMDTEDVMWEKKYMPFIINKCISPFPDTIFLVNEINLRPQLDKHRQYLFLLNSLRAGKRYAPWVSASKSKNLQVIKEYYGYSNTKANEALKVLTKAQIKQIKAKLDKGGYDQRSNMGNQ